MACSLFLKPHDSFFSQCLLKWASVFVCVRACVCFSVCVCVPVGVKRTLQADLDHFHPPPSLLPLPPSRPFVTGKRSVSFPGLSLSQTGPLHHAAPRFCHYRWTTFRPSQGRRLAVFRNESRLTTTGQKRWHTITHETSRNPLSSTTTPPPQRTKIYI